jgi:hypothetical protein
VNGLWVDVVTAQAVTQILEHDLDPIAAVAEDQGRDTGADQISGEPNGGLYVALPNPELGIHDGRVVHHQLSRARRRTALSHELDRPSADTRGMLFGVSDGRRSK